MGSWIIGMVDDPDDFDFFTIPGTMGVVRTVAYLLISKYTKHPEEAKKLLKWLVTEGQKIQVKKGGHVATYREVPSEYYPAVDRRIADKVKDLVFLCDLDDSIGGEFKTTFWDQLKLSGSVRTGWTRFWMR